MIERVHKHILGELNANTRTDTIFVLASILLNLIALAVNSAVAGGNNNTGTTTVVMFTFVALVLVISFVAEVGLLRGRLMRKKLLDGLLKMYKDQGVEGYYDPSLVSDYKTRYNLFMLITLFTGLIAIIIPFIIR